MSANPFALESVKCWPNQTTGQCLQFLTQFLICVCGHMNVCNGISHQLFPISITRFMHSSFKEVDTNPRVRCEIFSSIMFDVLPKYKSSQSIPEEWADSVYIEYWTFMNHKRYNGKMCLRLDLKVGQFNKNALDWTCFHSMLIFPINHVFPTTLLLKTWSVQVHEKKWIDVHAYLSRCCAIS